MRKSSNKQKFIGACSAQKHIKKVNLEKIDSYARTARRRREEEIGAIEVVAAHGATGFESSMILSTDSIWYFITIPPRY